MRRVLVDVDGVLADFHAPALAYLEREHGVRCDLRAFPTWDIFQTVDRRFLPAAEAEWAKPGWCEAIPVYEGAVEGLSRLREVAEVFFVTAQMTRSLYWVWERGRWLERHFGADDRHVVYTQTKHVVVGDFLVDDKLENVVSWRAHHPTKTTVLWTQPWNASASELDGIVRVGGWDELRRLVCDSPGGR